jgi:hypothetical protein
MQFAKPVGRTAAARKYDLLTALGSHALSKGKHDQRRALRFITLVTARYNWAQDRLAVGQREIAQLWSVDERTVKREMAVFRAQGWLSVRRQGARGRVTEYSLGLERILADSEPSWDKVGPDFSLRMSQSPQTENVVPLPVRGSVPAPVQDGSEWALAKAGLHAEDPALYASWIAGLIRADRMGGRLVLAAPSRFHGTYVAQHLERRILNAVREIDATVTELQITVAP